MVRMAGTLDALGFYAPFRLSINQLSDVSGLPLTFKFWKSRLPGCQFWKSRKKTWKSGTSKGDRWTTVFLWKLLL